MRFRWGVASLRTNAFGDRVRGRVRVFVWCMDGWGQAFAQGVVGDRLPLLSHEVMSPHPNPDPTHILCVAYANVQWALRARKAGWLAPCVSFFFGAARCRIAYHFSWTTRELQSQRGKASSRGLIMYRFFFCLIRLILRPRLVVCIEAVGLFLA